MLSPESMAHQSSPLSSAMERDRCRRFPSEKYFSQMELTVSSYSADQCLVSFNGEERLTGRESIVSLMDIIEGLFES